MELNKIMNADLLDILFEGKNKAYGAYELRKTYNNRIAIALISMAAVCMFFFLTQVLANDKDKGKGKMNITDVSLNDIKPEEKKPEPLPVPPPKETQQVKTIQVTPPLIVNDKDVTDPPPAVEELDDAQIGLVTHDGVKYEDFVAPPVEQSIGVVEEIKKTPSEDYEKIFLKVEKEARFPGGMEAWKRYLERNLNANVPSDDGASTGRYTVKVQFIVDKEGGISNVHAIDVPKACPSCGPEAEKVIKRGPKWEPAIQNDRPVNYQAVQSVTFDVVEE